MGAVWVPTVLAAFLAVGLIGGIEALRARERDESFVYAQQRVSALTPAAVEQVIARTPEHGASKEPAIKATCRPGASPGLRNPWRCTLRYATGTTLRYTVFVQSNGAITGAGTAIITGCCVPVPGSQ